MCVCVCVCVCACAGHVMNMLDMTFPDASFDVVIDKAATDALCVDEGSVWDPKPSVVREVATVCEGIHRCGPSHFIASAASL